MTPGRARAAVRAGIPVLAYAGVYAALLALMHQREGFELEEPLFIALVFGLGLSLLALWSTRGLASRIVPVRRPVSECVTLAFVLAAVTAFITWGLPVARAAYADPLRSAACIAAAKLAAFVFIPFLIWRFAWGYGARDFVGIPPGLSGQWKPVLWMSAAVIAVQLAFGRAVAEIASQPDAWGKLILGLPVAFLWLALETGLVEEFFFRALLQTRLAALLKSESGAIAVTAVLFGLAHAPGLYLRPASTGEGIAAHPSLLMAVGYAIVVTSVAGWFLGILWSRTRNLAVVVAVHAATDLFPNLTDLVKLWGWI